jgi:hypothetical protein
MFIAISYSIMKLPATKEADLNFLTKTLASSSFHAIIILLALRLLDYLSDKTSEIAPRKQKTSKAQCS